MEIPIFEQSLPPQVEAEKKENPIVERPVIGESGLTSELGSEQSLNEQTQIEAIRSEISAISADSAPEGGDTPPVLITSEPVIDTAQPLGILQDKDLRRRQKEAREKAPRQYSEMLVVFNDVQLIRSTDQEALGAFLRYVEANKKNITHLIANGDIVDFEAQSFFAKDLDALNIAPDEIEATRWLLQHLSKTLPDAKKVFIEGNHEARWGNMIDNMKGNGAWVKTPDEMFGFTELGWDQIGYGSGKVYEWHDRIFWHGHRSGAKTNIPKLELEDAGVSVTTAHVNRNMLYETTDARGVKKSGITHGGFSKDNLGFMKKANTGWSQGFGVYFWDKKTGEQPYLITMTHGQPRFIGPDGNIYDGTNWTIPGFEPKRGRPRKS